MNTAGSSAATGEPIGNFEQPILPIADPQSYNAVRSSIESAFSSVGVSDFMRSLARKDMRIRDFEGVLGSGLLGEKTKAEYSRLGNGDQGQIREFYLASLEQVAPDVREKFFKLYAYY